MTDGAARSRAPAPLRLVAFHEAGHAVAAFALGRGVAGVTVVARGGAAGSVTYRSAPRFPTHASGELRPSKTLDREVIILLSGDLGVLLADGRRRAFGATDDFSKALALAEHVFGARAGAYLRAMSRRAARILRANTRAVRALAAALLRTPTLSGRQARARVRGVLRRASPS